MSVNQDEPHHLPTLQAPVKALDPHGVQVVGLGTLVFAIGTVLCWWQLPALVAVNKGWWLSSGIVGTSIGVVALVVLLVRRSRVRRS